MSQRAVLVAVVAAMLLALVQARKPWFCHSIECPPFKALQESNGKYEVREYPETRWVSTVVKVDTLRDFRKAEDDAFFRL